MSGSTQNNSGEEQDAAQGSWIPLLVIIFLLVLRWIYYGEGHRPMRIRRWYNLQVRVCVVSPESEKQSFTFERASYNMRLISAIACW